MDVLPSWSEGFLPLYILFVGVSDVLSVLHESLRAFSHPVGEKIV
jgi:hypothetical protein